MIQIFLSASWVIPCSYKNANSKFCNSLLDQSHNYKPFQNLGGRTASVTDSQTDGQSCVNYRTNCPVPMYLKSSCSRAVDCTRNSTELGLPSLMKADLLLWCQRDLKTLRQLCFGMKVGPCSGFQLIFHSWPIDVAHQVYLVYNLTSQCIATRLKYNKYLKLILERKKK